MSTASAGCARAAFSGGNVLGRMMEATDGCRSHRAFCVHDFGISAGEPEGFIHLDQLTCGEIPPRSRRDPCDGQWADPDAAEFDDVDTDSIHHLAHDMVKTFVQDHLDQETLVGFPKQATFVRNNHAPFNLNAIAQALHLRI